MLSDQCEERHKNCEMSKHDSFYYFAALWIFDNVFMFGEATITTWCLFYLLQRLRYDGGGYFVLL